jgi:hypothetical protein
VAARPYTVDLGYATGAAGQNLLVFTAREGFVTVLRDVLGWAADTAPQLVNISKVTGGSTQTLTRSFLKDGELFHLECRNVLLPGDELRVVSNSAIWGFSFTGYELTDV